MPGYGLPQDAQGLLPWSWAQSRLESCRNYWLATTRPDARPHLMIVWGLWQEQALYFSTGRRSRKARNLEANAHCVIGTEQAAAAVVLEGAAAEVSEVDVRRNFIERYSRKYQYDMAAMTEDILSLREPVYVVRPLVAFGLEEHTAPQSFTRWRFAP